MKVLLIDDNQSRTQEIEDILNDYGEEIITSHSIADAEKRLKSTRYDLVIVDLIVPNGKHNKELDEKAGLDIIKCIFEELDSEYTPRGVIVVSERLEDIDYVEELKLYPVSIIDTTKTNWQDQLCMVMDTFWDTIKPIDIAIITAVDTEFEALFDDEWEKDLDSGSISFYRKTFSTKNKKRVDAILFQAEKKGMVPACVAMSKLFSYYLPNKVAMIGICGGNPQKTILGDIIVADESCDYSSGSIKDNGEDLSFEIEPRQIQISDELKNTFKLYSRDSTLQYFLRRKVNMSQYKEDISIHLGMMACGPLVVKSKRITKKYIQPFNRNYYGIDMETYAVYNMCKNNNCEQFISIKSVSDFGDANKTHDDQKYCAKLSAELLKHYIFECL